ncbi:MAG: hypothetical protein M1820_010739 [Bogoriella megaspora]|nr:MAG: hypothetical protein M1820_010739 [Bogoriella megaspora]
MNGKHLWAVYKFANNIHFEPTEGNLAKTWFSLEKPSKPGLYHATHQMQEAIGSRKPFLKIDEILEVWSEDLNAKQAETGIGGLDMLPRFSENLENYKHHYIAKLTETPEQAGNKMFPHTKISTVLLLGNEPLMSMKLKKPPPH